MKPLQPRLLKIALIAACLLATTVLAARTFQRIFEAPADKVYSAALKAAETDGRITIIDENAKQRRLHLRVNVLTTGISEPPLGQPPSMPPISAGGQQEQWGGILLTLIVTPSGPVQSSVSIEAHSVGPGLATGPYPGRLPADSRNAQDYHEQRAACMMLIRMRSILKLPNGRIGGISLDSCQ